MAKKVINTLRLYVPAGQATPQPPIGPALGQAGVNIPEFCKRFNARTAKMEGTIPVVITVFSDRSFTFVTKNPPVAELLRKAAKVEKGSPTPNLKKVGKVTREQVLEIARTKLEDMNTTDLDAAVRTIEGTARSMGIEIVG